MATIGQIRGMLLEEIILKLLKKVGYRVINAGEDGTRQGPAGLRLRGRGAWHQIDALAALDYGPAFAHPMRLLIEAKCYVRQPVDISTIRNSVGVIHDVSENYFVPREFDNDEELIVPRYNYLSAVFSTSGYTRDAQRFAMAHQIFLIQYKGVPVLERIVATLLLLNEQDFETHWRRGFGPRNTDLVDHYLGQLRQAFRRSLAEEGAAPNHDLHNLLYGEGTAKMSHVIQSTIEIEGSYYGMIQGRYPVHLLSPTPISPVLFRRADEVNCRIYAYRPDTWFIEPSDVDDAHPGFFRLQFGLPDHVLRLVRDVWGNAQELAEAKRAHFSFMMLSGNIDGVRRQVRLVLDEQWLERHLQRDAHRRQ